MAIVSSGRADEVCETEAERDEPGELRHRAARGAHVREPGAIEHDADDAAHADHRDPEQARGRLDREHRRQREDGADEHPPRAAALVLVEAAQHPRHRHGEDGQRGHRQERERPARGRGPRVVDAEPRGARENGQATRRAPRVRPEVVQRVAVEARPAPVVAERHVERDVRGRPAATKARTPSTRRDSASRRCVSSIAMAYPAKPSVYSPASMATAKSTKLAAPSRGRCPSRHRVYATSAQTPRAVDTSASRFASQTRGIAWHGASAKTIVPKSAARGRKLRRSSARTPSVAMTHQKSECTWCQKGCGPNTKWSAQSSALGSGRRKRTTRRGSVHHGMTPRSSRDARSASSM